MSLTLAHDNGGAVARIFVQFCCPASLVSMVYASGSGLKTVQLAAHEIPLAVEFRLRPFAVFEKLIQLVGFVKKCVCSKLMTSTPHVTRDVVRQDDNMGCGIKSFARSDDAEPRTVL